MAEIMIKAAGFVFVIIIAFILKQVHVLEKRDGLTIATIIMNVTLPCALLTNASGVTIDQSMLILLLIGFLKETFHLLILYGYFDINRISIKYYHAFHFFYTFKKRGKHFKRILYDQLLWI